MLARLLLRIFALIYIVRFAWPALVSASGATVFGEPWLASGGSVTALLDSDIRYWGVTSATISALFLVFSFDIKKHLVALDVIMLGVVAGAVVRTIEIATGAALPGPALVATGFEWLFPLVWFVSSAGARREKRFKLEESIEIDAPKDKVWAVYRDFGGVDDWHPYMERASVDEGTPTSGIGAARTCEFGPKMAIRETVREWDDAGSMTIAIEFLKGLAPPMDDVLASVRVEPITPNLSRLVLTMSFRAKLGPLGGIIAEMMILNQYKGVFANMLAASKAKAETGKSTLQIVMPMSGRQLSSTS